MSGRPRHLEHGHSAANTRTYRAWRAMRVRCTNPNQKTWARYGGRGISVCSRWDDYTLFLADMGECPPKLTLERLDPNGHYEPGNCVWATYHQQRLNVPSRPTLTWDQVREIRALKGMTQQAIANQYGCHQTAVSLILNHKTWKE